MREWKDIQSDRDSFLPFARRIFKDALNKQKDEALKVVEDMHDFNDLSRIGRGIKESTMGAAYSGMYRRVMRYFAESYKKDISFDWDEVVDDFLATSIMSERIVTVTETTRTRALTKISEIIKEGTASGLGIDEIKKNILKGVDKAWIIESKFRAERIARTEIVSASNKGSLTGMESTGVPFNKIWITELGTRTRDSHITANNQTVGQKDDFIVDGESLSYPGDPRGSAGNVINCRCAVGHEVI